MLKVVPFLCIVFVASFAGSAPGQTLRPVRTFRIVQESDSTRTAERPTGKSPRKAFLFSAVFPGAGELYAGKKRGLAFSALEVGGITAYILLNRTGDNRKRTTYAFADAHWTSARCEPECTDDSVGEPLGPRGSQQYYEQIGKYEKFRRGWDDYEGQPENRQKYVSMRHRMNQAYKWATYSAGALLFNHAISAIDAALAARQDRGTSESPSGESRLRLRLDGDPISPGAIVSITF